MLSPVHAVPQGGISPYTPTSRQFLNPLYIPVPGRDTGGARIDWAATAKSRMARLRRDFRAFTDPAFSAFVRQGGAQLKQHARFMAADAGDTRFQLYLQWRADAALAGAQARAKAAGMAIGLIADVAVGIDARGSEAAGSADEMLQGLSIGAPPDAFNREGQDWGLTAFSPAGLMASGYDGFIRTLRAAMRHAGAVRLDHILGFKRLYLVPHGFGARDGAYVRMPFQSLLAITALESVAQDCVVIGEDLGTVPERFREEIAEWGIWSYRVMMFERDHHGNFCTSDHYAANALVTFNTHDLATFAGWRSAGDLNLKRSLGLDPGESDDARHHAWRMLADVLRHNAIERDDFFAVLAFLARTR